MSGLSRAQVSGKLRRLEDAMKVQVLMTVEAHFTARYVNPRSIYLLPLHPPKPRPSDFHYPVAYRPRQRPSEGSE